MPDEKEEPSLIITTNNNEITFHTSRDSYSALLPYDQYIMEIKLPLAEPGNPAPFTINRNKVEGKVEFTFPNGVLLIYQNLPSNITKV